MARRLSYQTLEVLALMVQHATADFYGLELAKAGGIPTGTIYPILRRLEDSGWVESSWEQIDPREQGRPRKRLYRLTGLGVREARRHLDRAQSVFAKPQVGLR
jgi:DNA-binding PadR family transcriptional regulator